LYPRLLIATAYREALVDRGHVGEPAARRNDRKRRAGLAAEEEQASVSTRWVRPLLGACVEIMEDRFARARVLSHSIERRDDDSGIHMSVVREKRADILSRMVVS
jgi:hypothetical protein